MKSGGRRRPLIALGILLAWWHCAYALDPSLDVNQYAHTAWKISEGLFRWHHSVDCTDGRWVSLAGHRIRIASVRWRAGPSRGSHRRGSISPAPISEACRARATDVFGLAPFSGLASWKDGKLTHYPELDGQIIEALLEDREGTIWVAGWAPSVGRLCRIQSGNIQCYGEDGRFGSGVTPLYEDSGGNLWAGAMNGLWRWKPGPPKLYPMPDPAQRIYALARKR